MLIFVELFKTQSDQNILKYTKILNILKKVSITLALSSGNSWTRA